jgi:hypothetical protein
MGRTVPSFRIALAMEENEEWKPFRNALDKKDRKNFDEMMFELPIPNKPVFLLLEVFYRILCTFYHIDSAQGATTGEEGERSEN